MAQKDKVKELVGRGLGSYHTKALQQMDRIEKKNKEQNHKINILTNELDNDYLTKTEEGSVISLEHSKEGMIYLDELQGNTLVNYCTDGAKELTLNGDIDAEGTNVTLTEGVDNGLVDVMCEGNTLVNCILNFYSTQNGAFVGEDGVYKLVSGASGGLLFKTIVKPNTTYTLTFNVHKNVNAKGVFVDGHAMYIAYSRVEFDYNKGIAVFRTKSDFSTNTNPSYNLKISVNSDETSGEFWVNDFMLLEGDWSNKEVPPYFEGMKSVGELEDNKIEILSKSKNLLINTSLSTKENWDIFNGTTIEGYSNNKGIYSEFTQTPQNYFDFLQQNIFVKDRTNNAIKNNTWYTFSFYVKGTGSVKTHIYPTVIDISEKGIVDGVEKTLLTDGACNWNLTDEWVRHSYTFKTKSNIKDIGNYGKVLFRLMPSDSVLNTVTISCPMLEEGKITTDFINDKLNKKEILINEPLRGLPDGVQDKIVKISGKWYVKRNCGYVDDFHNLQIEDYGKDNDTTKSFYVYANAINAIQDTTKVICDKFITLPKTEIANVDSTKEGCSGDDVDGRGLVFFRITKSKLTTQDVEGFRQWLLNNNIKYIYGLKTPTYEEITDVELITYLDTTHISNNSTIPCNMKVTNTGYNAIIKPSTQYTVALDTNKSGTIGINLGGAKATTTNNVATITTPATLTDDSLRLYGKDIKASKVRLLEGDKTNWIPSHFEGMKSSFEDKLQEDGTYKMEILSNNKNLIDMFSYIKSFNNNQQVIEDRESNSISIICNNAHPYSKFKYRLFLKDGEKIYVSYQGSKDYSNTSAYFDFKKVSLTDWYITGTTNPNGMVVTANRGTGYYDFNFYISGSSSVESGTVTFKDIMISKVDNNFVLHKSNKIQFSSIEPLRSVDKNIKDKLIFKDGKLIIERNCGKTLLDGTETWGRNLSEDNFSKNRIRVSGASEKMINYKHKGKLCVSNITNSTNISLDVDFMNICGLYESSLYAYMPRKVLGLTPTDNDATSIREKWLSWLRNNNIDVVYELAESTYEEIPFELQKIILEGYENGTLFFDTNIPPTSTATYAGETPIVKSVNSNKIEVLSNTNDINDNIIPYLMDMDYRVVCLQLENEVENISMSKMFGGAYEMLKRDIETKRYSIEEYKHRLNAYLNVNKLTEEEYNKLGDMLNE